MTTEGPTGRSTHGARPRQRKTLPGGRFPGSRAGGEAIPAATAHQDVTADTAAREAPDDPQQLRKKSSGPANSSARR